MDSSSAGGDITQITMNAVTGKSEQHCETCKHWVDSKVFNMHTDRVCYARRWMSFDSRKYDMVSIYKKLTKEHNFQYVRDELKKIYPKVASKVFDLSDEYGRALADIFVESREVDTIDQFIKSGGYAGLSLAEFLEQTIAERQLNASTKEV